MRCNIFIRRTVTAISLRQRNFAAPQSHSYRCGNPPLAAAFSSTNFKPPDPPRSKGQPVFDDIDFDRARGPESDSVARNSDPSSVFVVNGSSRGIGLQFVKSLLKRTQGNVVACCRSPDNAGQLNEFISSLSVRDAERVHVLPLNVENQASIDLTAESIRTTYGRVDVLLNVAGILGDGTTTTGPERALSKIDRDWVEKSFAVNAIGPLMLSKAVAPLMQSRRRVRSSDTKARPKSVIANLSARVGSISDNELGGWYSYRMSKAALNQATRTMSHELKRYGTLVIALHPGTTDTDLSRPFQGNVQKERLFPVEFTVDRLLDVIDSLDDSQSGGLYDWAGKALPF